MGTDLDRLFVALACFCGALACGGGCSSQEHTAASGEAPPLAGSRGGECLPNGECYGGLTCENGSCAGEGRPRGTGGSSHYDPGDAGLEASDASGSDGAIGTCNPAFCPNSGVSTPCCATPDGPCGFDEGSGCKSGGIPEDPCHVSECPPGDGTASPCCQTRGYPHVGTWTICGFDYGGGCEIGPQLANWCELGKCPSRSVGWSTFDACCPGGTDARCGSATHCGLMFNRHAGCGPLSCEWSFVPEGCIERDQPGVVTTDCPSASAVLTDHDPRYGASESEFELPGCRRTDGICGLWYGDFGLGCLDTDVVRPEDERGIICPLPLADDFGPDAGDDGGAGEGCHENADCAGGSCSAIGADPGVCTNGKLGAQCASDSQCESGLCTTDGSYTGICVSGENGEPCNAESDCTSQHCADMTPFLDGYCTSGEVGDLCDEDAECVSARCAMYPGYYGICVAGDDGDPCDAATDCASGRCVTMNTVFGRGDPQCGSGERGASCSQPSDCKSGECGIDPSSWRLACT